MKKFRFNNSFVSIITIASTAAAASLYIFHFAVELNARRHEHLVTVINFFLTAFLEFIISSAWLNFYFFIASKCLILTRINAVLDVELNEI